MQDRFFIYGLVDPRDGQLRYIGKSCHGFVRVRSHEHPSLLKFPTYKNRWIKHLLSLGLHYEVVVIQEFEEQDILSKAEVFWIAYFRRVGHRLTNTTDGGEGTWGHPVSESVRKRISEARKGKPLSAAHRAKISRSLKGKVNSEESKRKESQSRMGMVFSDSHRLNLALAHGARPFTDQTGRIYLSISQTAREMGVNPSTVSSVLRGKRKSCRGHYFRYVEG